MQRIAGEPRRILVLIQMYRLGYKGAYEAMHRQMKIGIVPLNGFNQFADLDFGFQLLPYFTDQSLLRAFPGLDLAFWKLTQWLIAPK